MIVFHNEKLKNCCFFSLCEFFFDSYGGPKNVRFMAYITVFRVHLLLF